MYLQIFKKSAEKSAKEKKYEYWDRIFGWGPHTWIWEEWPSKNRADYYLKNCPGKQISDPDLPF